MASQLLNSQQRDIPTYHQVMPVIAPSTGPLYHVAMVWFLLSYISWKLLFLRVTLAFAFLFLLLFSVLATADWVAAVVWNSIFIVINVIHIIRLLYRMRRVRLRGEEAVIFENCFKKYGSFTPVEFKELWNLGHERFLDSGRFRKVLCTYVCRR